VRVHLPPGYDPARRDRYPLLLLHDGQNLFTGSAGSEEAESSAAVADFVPPSRWSVDETIDRLVTSKQIPAVVTAAIDHAGKRRVAEFTPTPGRLPEAGKAREYGRLVMNEVLPGLAADFHVRTDAAGVTMGGSSLGGLITLWLALNFPGRFGRLIVMSPSVWWDDRVILRRLDARPLDPAPRIWLDVGKREGAAVLRDVRALRDVLKSDTRAHLKYVEEEDGEHSEVAWGRRLADALVWIYSGELPNAARLRRMGSDPVSTDSPGSVPALRRALAPKPPNLWKRGQTPS
jgi:enterochelin esterase-like enzyme